VDKVLERQTTNAIPVMDDPMGRNWEQPGDVRFAPMDDTHVILTRRQVRELHEYSATIPTGVYPGKCWRMETKDHRHYLRWYGPETPDRRCSINHREILVV
jgi:hypothetical protein